MNQRKYLWTLYLIIATIVISITVQVYWNYKNYQENKKQFFSEVQNSLDNATDLYYADLAKSRFQLDVDHIKPKDIMMIDMGDFGDSKTINIEFGDSIPSDSFPVIIGNMIKNKPNFPRFNKNKIKALEWIKNKKEFNNDSIKIITEITSVFHSLRNHSLDFKKLDTLLKEELKRKNINLVYTLNHYGRKGLIATNDSVEKFKNPVKTLSKSTYLRRHEKIELVYPNQTKIILRNGLVGILLSFLLSLAIISSLFYLLNIIKKQKEIAEIKNDFINNITHEFKTPIATIGIANEAMRNFDILTDKQKTDEYLSITNNQVKKLNLMVEKVLETSTLDSESLLLQKESVDITAIISKVIYKYKIINEDVAIRFTDDESPIIINVDAFHFENVINNLIDNAIKYGENPITVNLQKKEEKVIIKISDKGIIPKSQREKIFDKFYRIPKGNKHDIKGFGIGLYYAKKIIEKHNGTLQLLPKEQTVFKIIL